jgi:hypothetical protein
MTTTTITPDQLDELQNAVADVDGSLCSYSGRAMYGRQCLGIELSSMEDAFRLALSIESGDLAYLLSHPRFDSMGLGIICYFPSVEAPEGIDDDEDEDDED